MDAHVAIPREPIPSLMYLSATIPAEHPSAAVLGSERLGAGVAVAPDAVLTAHYLVLGAAKVELVGSDSRPREVRRIAVDHESGLALLSVEGPPLRPVRIGRADRVEPGLPVFLLTCTGERDRKGASGLVSVVGPFEAFWEYALDRAIMTTVINPGLAGAPLFDPDARLIGIVSLGLAAPARYSLAIPIDLFQMRREGLEQGGVHSERAWIGFYPQGYDGGVVVTGVVPQGPADRAGLSRGDLILSVDGVTVSNLRELYVALWRKTPGDTLDLQVLRESSIHVVEVTAGDRQEFYR